MKRYLLVSILLISALMGCKKDVSVTSEYREYNYNTLTQTIEETYYAAGPYDFSENASEAEGGFRYTGMRYGSAFTEIKYWVDKTPQDLGYTGSGSIGSSHARTTPGPNGYWASSRDYHGLPSPSGGGGGGGGGGRGGGGCTDPYNSPTPNDAQLNALCQAAYTYRCAGYDSQADLTCAQYNSLASTGTSVPDCPYCN